MRSNHRNGSQSERCIKITCHGSKQRNEFFCLFTVFADRFPKSNGTEARKKSNEICKNNKKEKTGKPRKYRCGFMSGDLFGKAIEIFNYRFKYRLDTAGNEVDIFINEKN